ncbi:PDZ domain-containing protein [bacterium]|nr:PDZ domain-containing protein [bacterium]
MKGVKAFLIAVVISFGTIVGPVFSDVYDIDPSEQANRSKVLRYEVEGALRSGGLSKEEAYLVFKTDKLFIVSNDERKQICLEACKWALAKIVAMANDPTIPEGSEKKGFRESARQIISRPELKQFFHYDDVDFNLFNGSHYYTQVVRKGGPYCCGGWVADCYFYGFLKVKEKEIRKAAKLWGYSFKEFVRRLSETTSYWIIGNKSRGHKTKPIPPGARINFTGLPRHRGHGQLSLGKFGFSSNGFYSPDLSKKTTVWGEKYPWYWDLPIFENPIAATAANCSSAGSKIYSGIFGSTFYSRILNNAQRGVFHLPKYRLSKLYPWFGIKVKIADVEWTKNGSIIRQPGALVVTKVYSQSPAEKAGIKEGDVIDAFVGVGMCGERWLKELPGLIKGIAEFQQNGRLGHLGDTYIERNGKSIKIPDQKISVELRKKEDIPPGSY